MQTPETNPKTKAQKRNQANKKQKTVQGAAVWARHIGEVLHSRSLVATARVQLLS
jgi:hypothetical protein